MIRSGTFVVAISLAGLFVTVGTASPAMAKPTSACPEGLWELRTVASLAATGNAPVPGQVDAAGNNDGLVCALPLPDAVCPTDPCPVETIYRYMDNRTIRD